jgi:hypothetical protein
VSTNHQSTTIISRDGTFAVEISEPNGNFPVDGRDAFLLTVVLRATPGGKLGKAGGIFNNWFDPSLIARTLGIPTEPEMCLCFLEAAIGESLDESGQSFGAKAIQGTAAIECGDNLVTRWRDRVPATDREIEDYFKHRLFRAWQYTQRQTVFSTADVMRLHVPAPTLSRIAELGYPRWWKMGATASGLVVLEPSKELILAQRDLLDPAPDSPAGSIPVLLVAPRYKAPRTHWEKAVAFYGADQPDLANGAKEAISAVEALTMILTGSTTNTLGSAITWLRNNGKLNAALAGCLEKLWGFVNNSPGVRHGAAQPVAITPEEANFVKQVSEAAIRLLLAIDG